MLKHLVPDFTTNRHLKQKRTNRVTNTQLIGKMRGINASKFNVQSTANEDELSKTVSLKFNY
jgi:hypothetical protein